MAAASSDFELHVAFFVKGLDGDIVAGPWIHDVPDFFAVLSVLSVVHIHLWTVEWSTSASELSVAIQ